MSTSTVVTVTGAITLEFHNVGSLTSGWTRPTQCSDVPLVASGLSWPLNPLLLGEQVDNCVPEQIRGLYVPECEPDGSAGERLNDLWKEHVRKGEIRNYIGYHAPAQHCPEAWETVGVIAMNNGTPSASGLFSPTAFTPLPSETSSFPYGDFFANMFTSVLAPTETAVACCPRFVPSLRGSRRVISDNSKS